MPTANIKCLCGTCLTLDYPYYTDINDQLRIFHDYHAVCLPKPLEFSQTVVGDVSETTVKPVEPSDTDDILPYDAETNPVVFGVGDTVKICRGSDSATTCWVPEMDQTIGEIGEVTYLNADNIGVFMEPHTTWAYPVETLELVKAAEKKAE